MCVWILLILLKTENNKKKKTKLLFMLKVLCIYLNALFMSHEQCKRCWFKKEKKKKKQMQLK